MSTPLVRERPRVQFSPAAPSKPSIPPFLAFRSMRFTALESGTQRERAFQVRGKLGEALGGV